MNKSTVTAAAVMQLRERTGAGMMDCKKALIEADGDIEEAIIAMRKTGKTKADNKAHRVTAEGAVVIALSQDKTSATILELNSETDFVARADDFMNYANQVVQTALAHQAETVETLAETTLIGTTNTVDYIRHELIAKIGENIKL